MWAFIHNKLYLKSNLRIVFNIGSISKTYGSVPMPGGSAQITSSYLNVPKLIKAIGFHNMRIKRDKNLSHEHVI